jgi:hypothetical protein
LASGIALLSLGFALAAGGVRADEPGRPAAEAEGRDPATRAVRCAEEAGQLCPNLKPGRIFVVRCLRAHYSDTSDGCRAYLRDIWKRSQSRLQGLRESCSDELERLCAGVDESLGRLTRCLTRHRAELSPGCETAIPPAPGATAAPKQPPREVAVGDESAPD